MPKPTQFRQRLAGKVAVVTGAGGSEAGDGIGASIARLFAAEGARLVLVDRDPARADYTLQQIRAEGGEALIATADVTDDAACHAAVAAGIAGFGGLDILVNNAAILSPAAKLETMDVAVWDHVLATNLRSAVMMTRAALPAMTAKGRGAVVNIASIAALISHGSDFAYGPAKAGMLALSRDIAVAYGRDGIRSNVICPGHLWTPMVGGKDERARAIRRDVSTLGVEGDAWDIAMAALFLASDEARFITGVCLPVDGGVTAVGPVKAVGWVNAK